MSPSPTHSGFVRCREVLEFLGAYLDGEIAGAQRDEFERHLALCPACQAYLDTYRLTLELERGAYCEAGELAAPMPEELVAAILATRA